MLYIISTPIGNLKDITLRALDLLKEVDVILAEDTRRTGMLLKEYDIKVDNIYSYNDVNKVKRTKKSIEELKKGKDVALVSDAGTPGISDPGFYLIREAVREDIKVVPIPGACALIAGLVGSGLPTDKFEFYGFVPKKKGKKKKFLEDLEKNKTVVFYESKYRILKTLKLMNEVMPERKIAIGRELTKKFEEFIRGKVKSVYKDLKDKEIKGEMVVVVY